MPHTELNLEDLDSQFPALVPAQEEVETELNEPDWLEQSGLEVARDLERATQSQGRLRHLADSSARAAVPPFSCPPQGEGMGTCCAEQAKPPVFVSTAR